MTFNFRALAGALTLGVSLLGGSVEAEEINLRLAWLSADSPRDPYAITANAFKTAIEEAMPGRVSVALFPNRQLGDDKEILEGMQFGTIDMGLITNAVVANVEPTYQLLDLPFLFGNSKQSHAFLDGPIGQELAGNLRRHNLVSLGAAEGGFRNMINNSRPVTKPADVVGVKYRTMQNPVFIEMFDSLGGNPVPMAWGEVFTAMQQGTVDGLEIPSAVVQANNFFEVTKYLSQTRHTYSAIHLLMSERSFSRLPEDIQKAVIEAGRTALEVERQTVAMNEHEILESLKASGMEINDVEDVAPFREAVQGVYSRFEASIGADLLARARQAVSGN
ncbi:TRAP transporter substrate-binding protein [Actibacterium sp. MT2.3-13A]|uniref:TRAP transporter substrate-binding protein n=1 Tax=Actibacterium sp. MT2.3-13A TaxID=2828332 RepID=UPI001BA4E1A2|nr:TRAP transporter substrate-binding protein [Actibacterium sp. MT2.3-13A]